MSIEIEDTLVLVDLDDKGASIRIHISNADEEFDQTIAEWFDSPGEVCIDLTFRPAEILNSAIEMNEMPSRENKIDIDSKPLFDALRKDLVAMIEKIDALEFSE